MLLKYCYNLNTDNEKVFYLIEPLNLSKPTFTLAVYSILNEVYLVNALINFYQIKNLPVQPVKSQKTRYVSNC